MQAALIDKYRKKISVRFLSAIVGAATFGFIMPVELQILLHRGAEYLEMGEPTTKSYVVTSTSDNVRGCGNEVLVEQLSSLSGRRICKAPDEIWDTLKRGDVIELSGIETDFGFRHESMSKLRK